ncbi:MAG: hypothetical protein KF756_09640 [Acidobacteria bacterium]|nr:hypothetical protein [Acidobacteriota bacterium]
MRFIMFLLKCVNIYLLTVPAAIAGVNPNIVEVPPETTSGAKIRAPVEQKPCGISAVRASGQINDRSSQRTLQRPSRALRYRFADLSAVLIA